MDYKEEYEKVFQELRQTRLQYAQLTVQYREKVLQDLLKVAAELNVLSNNLELCYRDILRMNN